MARMTAKQRRFCDEYLVDLNATQAAIRAGYNPKTAYSQGQRLLKKVETQKYIEDRLDQLKSERTADAKEVMEYLTAVMRKETVSSVLARDETGADRVIEKPPDEKERLRAAELLGKAHMIFTERVQQDVDMELNITVDYGDGDEGGGSG